MIEGISRRHCVIEYDYQKGGVYITDLNSTNGSYLNGKRLPRSSQKAKPGKQRDYQKVVLCHGDELLFNSGTTGTLVSSVPAVKKGGAAGKKRDEKGDENSDEDDDGDDDEGAGAVDDEEAEDDDGEDEDDGSVPTRPSGGGMLL